MEPESSKEALLWPRILPFTFSTDYAIFLATFLIIVSFKDPY